MQDFLPKDAMRLSPPSEPQFSNLYSTGLSLLELLMVIAVVGIVSGTLSLPIGSLVSHARLNNAARQVAADLQLVRMKAIAQNRRLRVTFRPAAQDYIVERDDGDTWQPQSLHGHTAGPTGAVARLPPGIGITTANSRGDVIFVPRGHVDGGMTIVLGTHTGAETRRVIVNLAGRVRIE